MIRRLEPLISIITPTFNSFKYIETTIQSVINQSYKNFEYIIIDGGSKDGTLEIVEKYKDKLSYWISEPDSGMYQAINKGIAKSNGSIIAYLNSDDIYYPDTLKKVVNFFNENDEISLVYGRLDFIDKNSTWLYTLNYPKFFIYPFTRANFSTIGQPASFWRSSISGKNKFFDEDLKLASDFDFFIRIGRSYKVSYLPEILAAFRIHNQQLTITHSKIAYDEIKIIQKRYIRDETKIKTYLICFIYNLFFKAINIRAYLDKLKIYVANKNVF